MRYPFSSAEEYRLIDWRPSVEDLYFNGAKLLMVHVLFNLIKNALHFIAKARKGKIKIWLVMEPTQGHLYFRDTGIGISSNNLPRIFERFYSTTLSGTGIGLSFCRLVLESFGGRITCRSLEGEFTEFCLTLPRIEHPYSELN
ncbi:MAG: ATP-binding protein [Legionellales bacterium]|nr:ATP-binding protein [Legionellales bacterium]